MSEHPIISETAVSLIEAVSPARRVTGLVGRLRRALRQQFDTALRVITEVAVGIYDVQPNDPGEKQTLRSVFVRIMGVSPAAHKRKSLNTMPFVISGDEFGEILTPICAAFAGYHGQSYRVFSDHEIIEARDELTLLLHYLLSVEAVARQVYGRASPALHLLALTSRDLNERRGALFLLAWLIVRRNTSIRENTREFLRQAFEPPSCHSPLVAS